MRQGRWGTRANNAPGGRRLLRRLPLLVALALMAWLILGDRPREITLVYDLPVEDPPTVVDVRIVARDGSVPAAIRWGNGRAPAANRQEQRASLNPGEYRVEAELRGEGGEVRSIHRPLEIGREDERIVLYLR